MAATINIPANQVLAKPVSSYYKGKAIRQQLAAGQFELDHQEESFQMKRDAADLSKRRMEGMEKELDMRGKEYILKQGAQKAREEATAIIGIGQGRESILGDGQPDPEGRANTYMLEALSEFSKGLDGESRTAIERAIEDGVIGPEEWSAFDAQSRAILGQLPAEQGQSEYKAKTTYVGEDGKEYHAWYDDAGNLNKTAVLAKNESGNPVNFEPPNAGERESAKALIDKDDVLSELSGDDKDIAIETLANDIRQIQANLGKSYIEASKMAIAGLKSQIKEESGFWSSKKVLDMDTKSLGDNEYVQNGVTYIRDEDGNWSVK